MRQKHRRAAAALLGFIIKQGEMGATVAQMSEFLAKWMGASGTNEYTMRVIVEGRLRDLQTEGLVRTMNTAIKAKRSDGNMWVAVKSQQRET